MTPNPDNIDYKSLSTIELSYIIRICQEYKETDPVNQLTYEIIENRARLHLTEIMQESLTKDYSDSKTLKRRI